MRYLLGLWYKNQFSDLLMQHVDLELVSDLKPIFLKRTVLLELFK